MFADFPIALAILAAEQIKAYRVAANPNRKRPTKEEEIEENWRWESGKAGKHWESLPIEYQSTFGACVCVGKKELKQRSHSSGCGCGFVFGCGHEPSEVALPPFSPHQNQTPTPSHNGIKTGNFGANCLIGCLVLQVLWLLHRKKSVIGLLWHS